MINFIAVLILILIGLVNQANSQNLYKTETGSSNPPIASVPACIDHFKDLPKIAERLNVKPNTGGNTVVLEMCDGTRYDFIALINALLDKMDKAVK